MQTGTQRFSPREFLRARRPERFSDSVAEESPCLDRSILEYHISTLTSRSQEIQFERFARRLAEREICPNLLPHTGPTGGGDSKVDAETYPVADSLSLGWCVGTGTEAASERWAFAFSAKKKWRAKLNSDVAKIAATGRGYTKAFFVSSQYIRDKVRAQLEDKLRAVHKLDVRILDRTWILDRVFGGGHESLAIEELGIATSVRRQVRKGPLDTQRENDLEEVEQRINAALQEDAFSPQLVNDSIESATLARGLEHPRPRGLEHPRTDVEGRLLRAERVANKCGTPHQRLTIAYERAWTAFWWHEDYDLFAVLYGEAEERAKGSRNAYDLELLTSLWFLLRSAVSRAQPGEGDALFQQRTATLWAELERLSTEPHRASTALQARTLLIQTRLVSSSPDAVDPLLRDLKEVVRQAEGLVGYPLESVVEMLTELGDFLGDVPAYEEVFETVVEITSRRKSEVAAARMLLKRGAQQLDADHPYNAIRSLGRALGRLYKHESRHDVVRALCLCGNAYKRVGLLWAARGATLAAASIATNDFWTNGEVTPLQAACYNRLKWLELQLGRFPHLLAWHEVDCGARSVLVHKGYDAEHLSQGELEFDAILGLLLLRSDMGQLKHLVTIPDVLDGLDLYMAAVALQYALGNEENLPEAFVTKPGEEETPHEFFVKWRDQPAAEDLPTTPSLYEGPSVALSSIVLGCRVTVECDNSPPCVEIAESVLAALESLLSTSVLEGVLAREPVLTMNVRKSDFAEAPFGFEMRDRNGRPDVQVRCSAFNPHSMSLEAQGQLKDKVFDLLVNVLARVFAIGDPEQVLTKLFRDELAAERALSFTTSFVALGNVLGHAPKTALSAWSDAKAREYPLRRSEVWDAADRRAKPERDSAPEPANFTPGQGDPPAELRDPEHVKHTQIAVVSLIRESLWNQAGWCGTAFVTAAKNSVPPILAPIFRNAEAAKQIFAQWHNELGAHDSDEQLRVTIIRGILKANPHAYRVVIGSNPETGLLRSKAKLTSVISRTNTMTPSSNLNLNRFLGSYAAVGSYLLGPVVLRDGSSGPVPVGDGCLVKRELHVRDAWEIGRNDVDSMGMREDDDPIIPPDREDAPVRELLRWIRERYTSQTNPSDGPDCLPSGK